MVWQRKGCFKIKDVLSPPPKNLFSMLSIWFVGWEAVEIIKFYCFMFSFIVLITYLRIFNFSHCDKAATCVFCQWLFAVSYQFKTRMCWNTFLSVTEKKRGILKFYDDTIFHVIIEWKRTPYLCQCVFCNLISMSQLCKIISECLQDVTLIKLSILF